MKYLWVITPHESLAQQIKKTESANKILNFSAFMKVMYRNVLFGKKRIINNKQQKFIIKKLNNSNKHINLILENWKKYQNLESNNLCRTLEAYQDYLKNHNMTDENDLWRNIIQELKPTNIKFHFYGFYIFKESTNQLITELSKNHICTFEYPIQKPKSIKVVQHKSENSELSWLQENLTNNCIIISQNNKKFNQISKLDDINTITAKPMASSINIRNAIKILENTIAFDKKFKKNDWLPILQNKFPNNENLNKWQSDNYSLIDKNLAQKLLGVEIWPWLEELVCYHEILPKEATYIEWAKHFNNILDLAGWPFISTPNKEHQALINFWNTNLQIWSMQDVIGDDFISKERALKELAQDCCQVSFRQATSPNSSLHLMNAREASGHLSDRVIIIGANNRLQIEQESSETIYWRLISQAKEVIFSYSSIVDSEPCQIFPPLLRHEPKTVLEPKAREILTTKQDLIAKINRKPYKDITSNLIMLQALCPIKSLFSSLLCPPAIDREINLLRGIVCHEVLAWFWSEIKTQKSLLELTESNLRDFIRKLLIKSLSKNSYYLANVSDDFILEIELIYLEKLIYKMLEHEKRRPEFKVLKLEYKKTIKISGYLINVRIDRLDLDDTGRHLIDYKTGIVSINNWHGMPPRDPQIPLYLADQEFKYDNVSYACLNKNYIGYRGFSNFKDSKWTDFISNCRNVITEIVKELSKDSSTTRPIDSKICEDCYLLEICHTK